jgi:hypothetical protein
VQALAGRLSAAVAIIGRSFGKYHLQYDGGPSSLTAKSVESLNVLFFQGQTFACPH